QLPQGCVWSVLGVGRHQLPMITLAALLGGHVRVGFEDNLYRRKGELARDNAHLVEMAVQMLHAQDKEAASPDEARAILGLATGP
ncbi:3-keto-5-aminohexanoate cleavage protein, partial [Arthrospira platensis SPKY2]